MRFFNGFEYRFAVWNEEYACPNPDTNYLRISSLSLNQSDDQNPQSIYWGSLPQEADFQAFKTGLDVSKQNSALWYLRWVCIICSSEASVTLFGLTCLTSYMTSIRCRHRSDADNDQSFSPSLLPSLMIKPGCCLSRESLGLQILNQLKSSSVFIRLA